MSNPAGQRATDQRAAEPVGAGFGGSWLDAVTGKLVVGVTTGERAAQVRQAGATPKVVRHSLGTLTAITGELDRLATDDKKAVAGLASWHVDQPSNSVVVSVVSGQSKAAVPRSLTRHGDAITVGGTPSRPGSTSVAATRATC